MLREELVDHLVFTGSTAIGRRIAAWGADSLVPTTLELSGADSALVLEDADPGLAAASIWNAVTMNGGQTCMAPRRALVDRRVYPQFLAALAPLASGARPRRLVSSTAATTAFELVRSTLDHHPRSRSLSGVAEAPVGDLLRPLAIVDAPADAPLVCGEHFAPYLAVVPFDSLDVALDIHAQHPQKLATSVFTAHPRRIDSFRGRLGTSIITINDCVIPTGHPGCTILGRGASGWGSSRGREGLLAMTRPVQVGQASRWLRPPLTAPRSSTAARLERLMLRWYGAR